MVINELRDWFKGIAFTTALISGLSLISAGVGWLLSLHLTMAVVGIGWLITLGVVTTTRFRDAMSWWGMILGVGIMLMSAMGSHNYRLINRGTVVSNISVREIPDHPEASRFEFTDAILHKRYQYLYTVVTHDARKSSTYTTHYRVAPLTSPDWQPHHPVEVWAVCDLVCYAWDMPINAAITADATGYRDAIDLAVQKHGLTSHQDARLLAVGSSLIELVRVRLFNWKMSVGILIILWVIPSAMMTASILFWDWLKRQRNNAGD